MKLFVVLSLLFVSFSVSVRADFTVSAEVTRSAVYSADLNKVSEYFKNISVYQKNFPGIISVKRLSGNESQWTYEIKAPMASPVRMPFVLVEKAATEDYMVFESKNPYPDYFKCTAKLITLSENETRISITISLKMVRENATDVHFMAPILGEKFISKEMKKDITEDLTTFLARCKKEI